MFTKLKTLRNQKSDQGFTIIEVMIVLAIAGLILLIVFLAVPALQRTSRNTQRKNDASAVAGAISNYISNNNGSLPKLLSDNGTNKLSVEAATTGNSETATLGFYTTSGTIAQGAATTKDGTIYIAPALAVPAAPSVVAASTTPGTAAQVNINTVSIYYGQDCTPSTSPRTAAIYYVTESGSGNGSLQCVEQ